MKFYLVLFLNLISVMSFAAEDWKKSYSQRACGRFEGDAYKAALQSVTEIASRYQKQCESENGIFSFSYKKGFCTELDPGSISCPVRCLVWGDVLCRLPLVSGNFAPAPGSKFIPGQKVSGVMLLKNMKSQPLASVTAQLSVLEGKEFVSVSPAFLAWDDLFPGATGNSTSQLDLDISPNATCGTVFTLNSLVNTAYGSVNLRESFRLGKFNGVPKTAAAEGLVLGIGGNGTTVSLPINYETSTPNATARKVQLKFSASTKQRLYVQFVLTSPNGKVSLKVSEGWASGAFQYDKDLTEAFRNTPSLGEWTLTAKVWGQEMDGLLTSYQLFVLPDSYDCKP